MKCINITSGQYLNSYLESKCNDLFIPFNEAMIQGKLCYPLFDSAFMNKRSTTHNVTREVYISKMEKLLNIKEYIEEIESVILWFGKDAFCIINLLTVLVYLEDLNYQKDIFINIVDDLSCEVLVSNIKINRHNFKNVYLNLLERKLIETTIDFIDEGLNDYLYITSNDNFVIDYIKENIDKISKEELLNNIMKQTYKYGLSDAFILSLIKRIKK